MALTKKLANLLTVMVGVFMQAVIEIGNHQDDFPSRPSLQVSAHSVFGFRDGGLYFCQQSRLCMDFLMMIPPPWRNALLSRMRCSKCGRPPAPVYLCAGHREHTGGASTDWAIELVPGLKL
jgi:hypothetical protein